MIHSAHVTCLSWGGVQLVSEATGVARATITLGIKEHRGQVAPAPAGKRRRPGGGRKAIAVKDPAAVGALERLVEPITADGGGSNGSRTRLWRRELQAWADASGLAITVCHYPPGTSKWNKIEHRLFAFITQNWRGRPLVSDAVILSLIASTTTTTGWTVQSYLATDASPAGIIVSGEEMDALHIERDTFHADWNYTIRPRAA